MEFPTARGVFPSDLSHQHPPEEEKLMVELGVCDRDLFAQDR